MTRKQTSQTASETGMTQEQQKQEQQQAEQMAPQAESSSQQQQGSKGKKGGGASKKTEEKKGGGSKNKEGGAKKNAKTSSSSQEGKGNKNQQESEKGKKGTLSPIPVSVVKSIKQKMDTEHPGMVKNMNEVKMVTEKFLETIVEMAKNKQSVALPNFFTFKPVLRNERVHRNPQNGSIVTKPAHYVLCMDVKNKLKTDIASIPVEEKKESSSSAEPAQ